MRRADAEHANVAKHICVSEPQSWWFQVKLSYHYLDTFKDLNKHVEINFS